MGELRRRLANRSDSEHEQVLVRLVVALIALAYLQGAAWSAGDGDSLAARCLPLAIGYVIGSLLLLGHLLLRPATFPARRFAGMALDLSTLTAALVLGEATAAVFYPFYLWITLGMGFRYGRLYLFVSAVISLISFAAVIATTPYWHQQPALAAGLWAALLMLPAYAASLLAKLTEAVDRAEAANRAKSRFLATMSHELRTPLNAIIGITDLLRGGSLDVEQRDLIRTARVAGENLLDMINDVLDVARIEAGKTTFEPVEFDLHRLLRRIRDMLVARAASQGLYLNLAIDPRVPHRLKGGERELRQILVNLVANAIKFTEVGGVTIRTIFVGEQGRHIRVRFEVEDTGIGIPDSARERIFEQFAQVDESNTRRFGGSGLGLAIARKLATILQGDLFLAPAGARGSCFILEVELADAPATDETLAGTVVVIGPSGLRAIWCERVRALGLEAIAAAELKEARQILQSRGRPIAALVIEGGEGGTSADIGPSILRQGADGPLDCVLISTAPPRSGHPYLAVLEPTASDELVFRALRAAVQRDLADESDPFLDRGPAAAPRRILLAEDNRTNQKVITRLLERAGHDVTVVGDGMAALDALERADFDLVLMDLNMPVMAGLDAVRLYRFTEPQRERPAIVALTADVTEETRAACAAAGIRHVVSKPVSAAALLDTVDRLTASTDEVAVTEPAGSDDNVVPHPRRASATPAIDRAHLERLRQLDQGDGFFVEVMTEFVSDAEQLVGQLKAAAAAQVEAALRDLAHAHRSSAAHNGDRALFELCLGWRGFS
ncbi:MAG: ATP-binding protein, partial [Geminicoccaceae bacterium]|nr:ATP-binding protein [Geminicoccaceae bacterium]